MATTKSSKKEPSMNFEKYLEQYGDYIPKYHRESLKILFKGHRLTKKEWDEKVHKEMTRPIG